MIIHKNNAMTTKRATAVRFDDAAALLDRAMGEEVISGAF